MFGYLYCVVCIAYVRCGFSYNGNHLLGSLLNADHYLPNLFLCPQNIRSIKLKMRKGFKIRM